LPEVLSTSPFTPAQLQKAVEKELQHAPTNALTATVTYADRGAIKSTVALRIDRERWVVGIGGFVTKDEAETRWGGFGSVSVRF
jgi:cell division protein FtsN